MHTTGKAVPQDGQDGRPDAELLRVPADSVETLLHHEPFLERIFEQSPHPMWVSDARGVPLRTNAALRDLLRVTDAELVGKYCLLEDPLVAAQGFMPLVQAVFEQGRTARFALDYDTSLLPSLPLAHRVQLILDMTISPLLDTEGKVTNAVIQPLDITRATQVEGTLRKVSMALEQSPVSVVIADTKGTIEYVNPKFTEVSGYSTADAIGQNTRLVNSGLQPRETYLRLWNTLRAGEVWEGNLQNRTKAGALVWEHVKISPIRDAEARIVAYVAIKEDITERKKAEAERRELSAQLHQAQKLESLGSLAGGVAHDLNNVLAAILSSASMHRETLGDAGGGLAKSLDTIARACLRGRDVVKGLLYFAHKDLETVGEVDLNALAEDIVQLLDSAILKQVRIFTDLQEPLGEIEGDAGALSHALMNLCVNSMDAMPAGGVITIRTRRNPGGTIELRVQDSGQGMSPEVAKKAVEPFFTTKPRGKGTGLGLSMVHGTMKAHKGSLEIRSVPGQGTEMILTFPCLAEPVVPPGLAVAAAAAPAPEGSGFLRILLVDADDLVREAIPPLLMALGHRVEVAQSGLELLKRLEAGLEVDLVILDMNMPNLNGAQTLPLLLALCPDQAVLMSTGFIDEELAPLLQAHPRVMSIRKPFTLDEIRETLQWVKSKAPVSG